MVTKDRLEHLPVRVRTSTRKRLTAAKKKSGKTWDGFLRSLLS